MGEPHVFSHFVVKVKFFLALSNFAISTHLVVISEFLNQSKMLSLHLDLKITFSLQFAQFLSLVSYCCSSEVFPNYSKTQGNSLLGNMKLKSLWIINLF